MAFRKPAPRLKRYPTLSRLILEALAEFGEAAVASFFPAKYPEGRLWRRILGLDARYRFKRETFSSLLSRLQAQGLVVRAGSTRKGTWRLTARGAAHVASLPPLRPEPPRPDGIRRLVVFDIPERERKKRDAIRLELITAGYEQLQKSVWHGERPLPKDFMELVDALSLRNCVHIFSVRHAGTLR